MKHRFIIQAIAISPPGTMGGNTKIALEMARNLASTYDLHVIVPGHKLATFTDNIADTSEFTLHAIPGFHQNDLLHPLSSILHYRKAVGKVFRELNVDENDVVYSATDGHTDVVPLWLLHRRHRFKWIGSFFLFVPGLIDNTIHRYGFPKFIYAGLWCYQRILFALLKSRCLAFVITNTSDARHFPARFKNRIFAFYGGVNTEQIPLSAGEKTRDVVFCSRLCYQKGIWGFLDTWKMVVAQCPSARLTIVGNGAPEYEAYLKAKAERLGVADTIDWLGYVNNEAKYAIYRSARVMVHPTVFDNNGMVAAEALCSGLPVVMYDLPALREVYTTGCVKVPFGNQARFAAEVSRLLKNPAAAAPDAGQVAELRAHWGWANRVKCFAAFLEKTMASLQA